MYEREVFPITVDDEYRYVTTCHGVTLQVVSLFDDNGSLCDADEAVVAVAGTPEFGWVEIDLRELEETDLGSVH